MTYTLAIDPGVSGALALILSDGGSARVVAVRDMPIAVTSKTDGKLRRRVDPKGLAMALSDLGAMAKGKLANAYVEHVHASPGMGVTGAFSFGHTLGTIEAVVRLSGLDVVLVSPTQWKRALNVPADKKEASAAATLTFGTAEHWPLAKHNGRAEAALIAHYAARSERTALA
jgi:hypothetical protein